MLFTILEPDFSHEDERGKLIQLVREGYRQVNVLYSEAGVIRGGHYHKKNREAFYIIEGECEAKLSRDGINETVSFSIGSFFQFEPYTVHAFKFSKDTLMIGMYDLGVENEDGTKDIFTLDS